MNLALLILAGLVLSGMLGLPKQQVGDPDIWWHLANARILGTTHHFIRVEPYSFTVACQPWINPEWLAEIPYWFGYRWLGLAGIYLSTMLILCANILFVYWRSYSKAQHAGAVFWTNAIGVVLMIPNSGPRTIMVAYLALSAEMAILEAAERGRAHLLWLLPPLFCVWINLHGSWVIGLALFVLYLLCGVISFNKGVFEQEAWSSRNRARLMLVLMASVTALLANPYGWRMIWNPFDMMLNQKLNLAIVTEWMPLNLSWFVGKAVLAAIALTVVANCIRGRKWKLYEMAFVFFAWFAAFDHVRFTFLAAVIAIPMLSSDVARSFFSSSGKETIPALNALFVIAVLAVTAYMFPSGAALQEGLAEDFPVQSIASIQPTWRTFNQDFLGGLMDLNSKPTFVDTRWDIFEHGGVLRDYLDIVAFRDPYKLLDKYRIDHVLVQASLPLATLLEHTPGWRVERREGTGGGAFELFARTPIAASDSASGASGTP